MRSAAEEAPGLDDLPDHILGDIIGRSLHTDTSRGMICGSYLLDEPRDALPLSHVFRGLLSPRFGSVQVLDGGLSYAERPQLTALLACKRWRDVVSSSRAVRSAAVAMPTTCPPGVEAVVVKLPLWQSCQVVQDHLVPRCDLPDEDLDRIATWLSHLSELPHVHTLVLCGHARLDRLPATLVDALYRTLAAMPKLRHLAITRLRLSRLPDAADCFLTHPLCPLSTLSKLHGLEVPHIAELSPLTALCALRAFSVGDVADDLDVPLEPAAAVAALAGTLSALSSLEVRGTMPPTSFDVLAQFRSLRHLDLYRAVLHRNEHYGVVAQLLTRLTYLGVPLMAPAAPDGAEQFGPVRTSSPPPGAACLEALAPCCALESLRVRFLDSPFLRSSGLEPIASLQRLQELTLLGNTNGCEGLRDEHLAPLERLRHLSALCVHSDDPDFTGTGLAHLAAPASLATLQLQGCPGFAAAGASSVASLTRLRSFIWNCTASYRVNGGRRSMSLDNATSAAARPGARRSLSGPSAISAKDLSKMLEALPELESCVINGLRHLDAFRLRDLPRLTNLELVGFANATVLDLCNVQSLANLGIRGCTSLWHLQVTGPLPSLREASMVGTRLRGTVLRRSLQTAAASLTKLTISVVAGADVRVTEVVKDLTALKVLDCLRCDASDVPLRSLSRLHALSLQRCNIDPSTTDTFNALRSLTRLDLGHVRCNTPPGAEDTSLLHAQHPSPLSSLRHLELAGNRSVDPQQLRQMSTLQNLTYLGLLGCSLKWQDKKEQGVSVVKSFAQLRSSRGVYNARGVELGCETDPEAFQRFLAEGTHAKRSRVIRRLLTH